MILPNHHNQSLEILFNFVLFLTKLDDYVEFWHLGFTSFKNFLFVIQMYGPLAGELVLCPP